MRDVRPNARLPNHEAEARAEQVRTQGQRACRAGQPVTDCPYHPSAQAARWWHEGFARATGA